MRFFLQDQADWLLNSQASKAGVRIGAAKDAPTPQPILYVFSFTYANRDNIDAPRWVVAQEQYPEENEPGNRGITLWNYLYGTTARYETMEALIRRRQKYEKAFGPKRQHQNRLVQKILGSVGVKQETSSAAAHAITRPKSSLIKLGDQDWVAINELLMPPTEAGRVFKRRVGGGPYGKLAQPFIPTPADAELYRGEIAQGLQQLIMGNPIIDLSKSD